MSPSERSIPPATRLIVTSEVSKRNSLGNRTAWLRPLINTFAVLILKYLSLITAQDNAVFILSVKCAGRKRKSIYREYADALIAAPPPNPNPSKENGTPPQQFWGNNTLRHKMRISFPGATTFIDEAA